MIEEELFEETPFPEAAADPEPQPEPVVETPAEPVVQPEGSVTIQPKQPEPGFVPFAAVLDERDKRKALEAELERQRQSQQQPEPAQELDVFDEGFAGHMRAEFQRELFQQRRDISHRFAVQQHGQEAVEEALKWGFDRCEADPHFNQTVMSQADPIGFVMQQMQREQIANNVDLSEYEQFKAWKAAQTQVQTQQPAITPSAPKPPKSIVSAPSAGGVQHVAVGDQAVFDGEFK